MKKYLLTCIFIGAASILFCQTDVKITYRCVKTAKENYEIRITATIDKGWHIYSHSQPSGAIGIPTSIHWTTNPLVQLIGDVREIGNKIHYVNDSIGIEQYQYEGQVTFLQKIKLKSNVKTNFKGAITYQICNEERCLSPRTDNFSIKVE